MRRKKFAGPRRGLPRTPVGLGMLAPAALVLSTVVGAVPTLGQGLVEKVVIGLDPDGDGNRDLFMIDPDGSNWVNLTPNSPEDEVFPRISPDGRRIAASAGNGRLMVYDLTSGNSRVFQPGLGTDARAPIWRTNEELIYRSGPFNEEYAVTVEADLSTSNNHRYIAWGQNCWPGPPAGLARLSADGTRFGGWAQDGYSSPTSDLFIFEASAVPDCSTVEWSYVSPGDNNEDWFTGFLPDGDILFTHNLTPGLGYPKESVIARTTASPSSTYTPILSSTTEEYYLGMAVSPAHSSLPGGGILYSVSKTSAYEGPVEIWIMDVDGGNRRQWIPGTYNRDMLSPDWGWVVPEPATVVLLAVGGLALLRRRAGLSRRLT